MRVVHLPKPEKRALTRRVTRIRENQKGSHQSPHSRPGIRKGRGGETALGSDSACIGDWRGWRRRQPRQPRQQQLPPPTP